MRTPKYQSWLRAAAVLLAVCMVPAVDLQAQKLSELTSATTVDSADLLPFVDVSDTTGAASGTTKRVTFGNFKTSLSLQPLDSDLTAIAALTTTSYGIGLLDDADATAGRVSLGLGGAAVLEVGTGAGTVAAGDHAHAFAELTGKPTTLAGYGITDAQPLDSDLTSIAALATTTFGRAFLAETDATSTRVTLGLGGAAVLNVGTGAGTVAAGDHAHAFAALTGKPTTLAGYGITDAQPLDSDLTSIAALTTTSFGRGLLDDADASVGRTSLGIVIGTDVQAYSSALATVAANGSSYYLSRSNHTGTQAASTITGLPVEIGVACSDETTAITTGTAKVTFRAPFAFTLTGVRSSLTTVSSSGLPTVDIKETGTSVLGTKLSIDASEKTSTTAAAAATITDSAIANDAEITIDVTVSGTGATGLKVWMLGTR